MTTDSSSPPLPVAGSEISRSQRISAISAYGIGVLGLGGITLWGPGIVSGSKWAIFFLVTAVLCSCAIWRRVHVGFDLDPSDVLGRYVSENAWVVYSFGFALGVVGLYRLLDSPQRHLVVMPEAWLAVTVGLGTGAVGLWAIISRSVLHRWVSHRAFEEGRRRKEGEERRRRHESLVQSAKRANSLALRLEEMTSQASQDDKAKLSALLKLGVHLGREAGRHEMAGRALEFAKGLDEELEVLCKSLSGSGPAGHEGLGRRLFERFLMFSENYSFVEQGASRPDDVTPRLSRWRLTDRSCSSLEGWFRHLVGYDSLAGPRPAAAFALELGYVACWLLVAWELPSSGISAGTAMTWLFLPFTGLGLGLYWLVRHLGNSRAVLVWSSLSAVVNLALSIAGALALSVSHQGEATVGLQLFLGWVGLSGLAPIGAWLSNVQWPRVPVEEGLPGVELLRDSMPRDLHRWRGEKIAGEWSAFFERSWQVWLNEIPNDPQLLASEVKRLSDRLKVLKESAFVDQVMGPTGRLLGCAQAHVDVARILHFSLLLSMAGALGLEDDDLFEREAMLIEQRDLALERWHETHGNMASDELPVEAVYSALSRQSLYPPAMHGGHV